MGIVLYSPRLDAYGNSVKVQDFCRRLVKEFTIHKFDMLTHKFDDIKKNPSEMVSSIYEAKIEKF